MPRFSLKQLLEATTLLAVGIATVYWVVSTGIETDPVFCLAAWPAACSMIGYGLFLPFGRAATGAWIGFILALVVCLISFWVMSFGMFI